MASPRKPRKNRHNKAGWRHGEQRHSANRFLANLALHARLMERLGKDEYYKLFPEKMPKSHSTFPVGKIIGQYRNEKGNWENIYDAIDE